MSEIIVKESSISGKGVFANKNFKKGDVVLKWDLSRKISDEEIKNLSDEDKKYLNIVDGKNYLFQPPEKYINHSCNPNTNVKETCDVAIKDIKKGEEITSDYSNMSWKGEFVCKCGSKNCKKIIRGKK